MGKNHNAIKRLILLITISISIYAVFLIFKKSSCDKFICLSPEKFSGYDLGEVYQADNNFYYATYQNGDKKIRIHAQYNIDKNGAERERDLVVSQIKSIFAPAFSPYPGVISDEIECSDKYLPRYGVVNLNDIKINTIDLFAGERLTYGACVDDLIKYEAKITMFYCPENNSFYKLEFFFPRGQTPEIPEDLRCL